MSRYEVRFGGTGWGWHVFRRHLSEMTWSRVSGPWSSREEAEQDRDERRRLLEEQEALELEHHRQRARFAERSTGHSIRVPPPDDGA